jgi:hypothetical protein
VHALLLDCQMEFSENVLWKKEYNFLRCDWIATVDSDGCKEEESILINGYISNKLRYNIAQ